MSVFELPTFHAPFQAKINVHGRPAWEATREWMRRTGLVRDEDTMRRVERHRYWDLAARTHPLVGPDELAICAEWIMWLFFFDDSLDDLQRPEDHPQCRRIVDRLAPMVDAPFGDIAPVTGVERAMVDICRRTLPSMSAEWGRRYLKHVGEYVHSMQREVDNRFSRRVPDLIEYADLRRQTGAVATLFDLIEFASHVEVPERVHDDALMINLENAANDCITLTNDILSYPKEVASGEVNNYVVVAQRVLQCPLEQAVAFVNNMQTARAETFCSTRELVERSYARWRLDAAEQRACDVYMAGMESWIRGSLDYSYGSERYRCIEDFRLPNAA